MTPPSALTMPNPKLTPEAPGPLGPTDEGWLSKVTIVKASSPNVVGDYAFPGFESDLKYVKFRFRENMLQMIDGRKLQHDDANDTNDDLATIEQVARDYGATMLQLGGPTDGIDVGQCPAEGAAGRYPTGSRPALGQLYCGYERPGYEKVYQNGDLVIYRLSGVR